MLILGLIDIPIWIILILFLILGFYMYTERKHNIFKKHGLKGPKPAPFIGGLPLLKRKGVMQCEYEGTMEYGKCFSFFLGNLPTVFTTDTEIIQEMFVKRFSTFPNRTQAAYVAQFWQQSVLMATDHDHWKFLRSTLSPSFSSGKLKRLNPLVVSCIDKLIDRLKEEMKTCESFEMVKVLKSLTMDVICRSALGVEMEHNVEFMTQVDNLLNFSLETNPMLILLFLIPDFKHFCKMFDIDYNNTKSVKYIRASMQKIVAERKANPLEKKQDLLQLMIDHLREEEPDEAGSTKQRGLTDEELISNAITFLFAGYDTTSVAMTFSAYFLATEQECQERVRKEIEAEIGDDEPIYEKINDLKYLDMFISEVMRLYPPVTRLNRQNTEVTTIGEYTFPKNISITVPVFTLHRLPEYWENPLKFDPERFSQENKPKIKPYTYLPFGAGPRNCIGSRFAQQELKLTLVKLVRNFYFEPAETLKVPPELEKNVFCRPVGGMPIKLKLVKE